MGQWINLLGGKKPKLWFWWSSGHHFSTGKLRHMPEFLGWKTRRSLSKVRKGKLSCEIAVVGKMSHELHGKGWTAPGRGSQPHKCPGERRKMKLGSGNEGLVVSCFGISGLFSQQQSHPAAFHPTALQAGEMSQLQARTEGGGNWWIGKESLGSSPGLWKP